MSAQERLFTLVVVIVNYRRARDTLLCIQSLLANGLVEAQIILVDNGSGDDSVELIQKEFPSLQLYVLPENVGFSGGFNFGIQQALAGAAEKVLILNNDTIVEAGSIQRLVEAEWDVAVPKILFFDDPNMIWAAGCRWRQFPPSVVMIGYEKLDQEKYNQPSPLRYATGCVLMVRREVLVELGGFDPIYSNYMEDYDFSYRVQEAGFSMGYIPEARVLHKISQTLGVFSPSRWNQQGKNTVLFYRRAERFPRWTLWGFMVWFTIRESVKFRFSTLLHFWHGVRLGFDALQKE